MTRDLTAETPIGINLLENGWLMMAVWERARDGDRIARGLYVKLKAAAIAAGVEWYYGDPWVDSAGHLVPLEPENTP